MYYDNQQTQQTRQPEIINYCRSLITFMPPELPTDNSEAMNELCKKVVSTAHSTLSGLPRSETTPQMVVMRMNLASVAHDEREDYLKTVARYIVGERKANEPVKSAFSVDKYVIIACYLGDITDMKQCELIITFDIPSRSLE